MKMNAKEKFDRLSRYVVMSILCAVCTPTTAAFAGTSLNSEEIKATADELLSRGKYREAAAAYGRLVRFSAAEPELAAYARFKQGVARHKDGRTSEAFALWAQLRMFHPRSEFVPVSLLLEADAPGNPTRTEKLYDEILIRFPLSPEAATVLIKRGQAACDRKDYRNAIKTWQQFVQSFPDDPTVGEIKARLETLELAWKGDAQSALKLEVDALLPRAAALFDRAEFAEAARLYERVLDRFGDSDTAGHVATRLAQCQLMEGREQQAFETLQRAADKSPSRAPTLLAELVSQTASRRQSDGLRLRATKLLVERYPNTFEAEQALYVAGFVEMTRNHVPQARQWWEQLLTLCPQTGFRDAIERQLRIKGEEKQKEEARKQMAAEPKKGEAEPRKSRERQRAEDRDRWQAETREFSRVYVDLDRSVEERSHAAYRVAERNAYLEQYELAAQQYQRVWTEFPSSPWAEQAAFDAAQMWFKAGRAKKGMEQLYLTANQFPGGSLRPLALYCLGNRHLLGEWDAKSAWANFEALMTDYPEHPLTRETQRFWARLNKYPPVRLKVQLAHLKAKSRTNDRP